MLGDFQQTLASAGRRIGALAALAHADIGTGDRDRNARLAAAIAGPLEALIAPLGVIVADQRLHLLDSDALELPDGVTPGRYFMYRKRAAA